MKSKKMWWKELVRNGREVPSQGSRGPVQTAGKNMIMCFISSCRRHKFLLASKHLLSTPAGPLPGPDTPHLEMEYIRPDLDSAGGGKRQARDSQKDT